MPQHSFNSPVGALTVTEEDGVLVSLDWGWACETAQTPLLLEAQAQLDAYFDRKLTAFDLPMTPRGTAFQERVWAALTMIPYGETRSYGALALQLGSGARAVGTACGLNPLPILIPCHRILGTKGALGGYSGEDGVETKRRLLRLEGATWREPATPVDA
ncbi:MAG: methylated-DNA--[protein]-cysteine S-methyltransferase [Rhodospirillaceae bacterium]